MRLLLKFCITSSYFFFCAALSLHAQKWSSGEHDKKLESLCERKKVDHIINNQYALYSADALNLNLEAAVISKRNEWKDKEAYAEMFQGVIYFLKGARWNELQVSVVME